METYTIRNDKVQKGIIIPLSKEINFNSAKRNSWLKVGSRSESILNPIFQDCCERGSSESRKELHDEIENKKCPVCGSIWTQWKMHDKTKSYTREHPNCGQQIVEYIVYECGVNTVYNIAQDVNFQNSNYYLIPSQRCDSELVFIHWEIENPTGICINELTYNVATDCFGIEGAERLVVWGAMKRNARIYAEHMKGKTRQKIILSYEIGLVVEKGGSDLFNKESIAVDQACY